MGDTVDDLTNSAILGQSRLSGSRLRVRYVFLSLSPAFADNQIVPGAVTMTLVTPTARPGADREPLYPRAVQHVR